MDPFTAIAIGTVASAGVSYLTGKKQAEAMGDVARAQQAAAAPGYEELATIDRLLENRNKVLTMQEDNIRKEIELLDAVDPALKEAGAQALELIRGKDAPVLDPIKRQREDQRKRLEQTLSSRLGPGWASSSAGIEALTKFDMQTDMLMMNAQQGAISQMLGVAANVRPDITQEISTFGQLATGMDQTILKAHQNIAGREAQTAGSQFAEQMYKAQAQNQTMGSLFKLGGELGTAYMLGQGLKTTAPTPVTSPTPSSGVYDTSNQGLIFGQTMLG